MTRLMYPSGRSNNSQSQWRREAEQLRAAYGRDVWWRWTVYGISGGRIEDTLAEAQRRFKETYEAANGDSGS
jgi:hypothetical protein